MLERKRIKENLTNFLKTATLSKQAVLLVILVEILPNQEDIDLIISVANLYRKEALQRKELSKTERKAVREEIYKDLGFTRKELSKKKQIISGILRDVLNEIIEEF